MSPPPHLLVVEARFYDDISDALAEGCLAALAAAGATYERVVVPGALEIPGAVAMAAAISGRYDGYVALGCVIRGETSHYETVANESARGLMTLCVHQHLAIGNGILTVENEEQAWARARRSGEDKGGGAARAALALIALRQRFTHGIA
jgi:6,7-dimethyl-8-ribityllumazine synthase